MPSKKKDKKNADLNRLKAEATVDYHKVPLEDLFRKYDSSVDQGLSHTKVVELRALYGENCLTPPKTTPEIVKLIKKFFSGFLILLEVGSALCIISYIISVTTEDDPSQDNLWLGVVLFIIVVITALFDYFQEAKSSKIMNSFSQLIPQSTSVIREGKVEKVAPKDLVIGDVILLNSGDSVPADVRIISAQGFKVDNSSLTGESEPQRRTPENTSDELLEATNMVFAFTFAVEGNCKALVVSTGDNTFMGRIAVLTSNIGTQTTPIGREIQNFVKLITFIAIFIGIVFFIISITLPGADWISCIIFFIGMVVANVPEGLIVTVTTQLTFIAKKMARKNCLVKNLESVETLGSTSVICSDKTGTLTQNRMTVSHIWTDQNMESLVTEENTPRIEEKHSTESRSKLFQAFALCTNAQFQANNDPDLPILRWAAVGDASETALIKCHEIYRGSIEDERLKYPKIFEIPFNSQNKYYVAIRELEDRYLLLMKGAPERIVKRCSSVFLSGQVCDMTDEHMKSFHRANEEMGEKGERVLGFCYKEFLKKDHPDVSALFQDDKLMFELSELIFLALISMIDPPRSAVPHAVEVCRSAGIRVIMVTGDQPVTAKAIAKKVGIVTCECERYSEFQKRIAEEGSEVALARKDLAIAVTGTELRDMEQSDIIEIITSHPEVIFARTSPQQKLIIVESFQKTGAIVSVTGDGVNDSPALRKADIGVAMGIAGSDVAKKAADMILLDDNFATIVTGIEQGRLIFDNLKKSIAYTLTSNIPEITPFILFALANIPLPLSTITILCIDLGTDLFPAISLAYEKPELDIMKRKPRNAKTDALVSAILINYSYLIVGILQAAGGMAVYLLIMMDHGFKWETLTVAKEWNDKNVPFVIDSYGEEWSYQARKDLEFTVNTAYFITIVIIQMADLLLSKTRRTTIFRQGIFSNKILIFSIYFEIILAIIISYIPPLNKVFFTRAVHPKYFIVGFVVTLMLWLADELRRLIMRRNPGGFIERETYY